MGNSDSRLGLVGGSSSVSGFPGGILRSQEHPRRIPAGTPSTAVPGCSASLLGVIPSYCSFQQRQGNYGHPASPFWSDLFLFPPLVSFGLREGNSFAAAGG